jgi:leucyl/phenylalanyl-tRNA--protein transferase
VSIEPPRSPWGFPSVEEADSSGLVGVGADYEPGTILAAYRSGLFPMPIEPGGLLGWWSPDPRGVLELDDLHVSRSLARSMTRFEFRVNTAFDAVIAGCADPARPHGWIDARVTAAYRRLHELGWCHSIETWCDGELVGGLYGIAIGGLFAAESKFHRVTDASKAAVVALVEGTRDGEPRLIDVQWSTPHLVSLGVTEVRRSAYVEQLPALLESPPSVLFAGEPRTITVPPRA